MNINYFDDEEATEDDLKSLCVTLISVLAFLTTVVMLVLLLNVTG